MKKREIGIKAIIGICAALGWWGVIYPELTMTPDTYRIVCEDGTVQNAEEVVEWDFDSDIYGTILDAEGSRIRFRSRLLANINASKEHRRVINESGD